MLWPVLEVATISKSYMPVSNVNGGTKAVVEGQTLSSELEAINNDANDVDIDRVATVRNPKRKVSIWLILVVVITDRRLTKVAKLIIVLTISRV